LSATRLSAALVIALLVALFVAVSLDAQSPRQAMQQDPACQALTPAAAGGAVPKDPETVVIRWLGHTNYELVYRGNVFLLDTYYDRVPRSHPIGVAPADLKKATAIFVGHPHFDHISDAPIVAKQTGAQVVAAPSAGDFLAKAGISTKQFRAVKGGEVLQFPGMTVEAVLGRHNMIATTLPEGFLEKQNAAVQEAALQTPYSPEEQKQADAVRARSSRDPNIATTGVINYLFTLGNNFRVMFADSPGPVTDGQRALMGRVSSVDVAMLPYFAFEAGIPPLVELVKTFKPSTVFLGHHDGAGTMQWASNYPPAYAIRAASPQTRTLDVLYRTPVCFNTATKDMVIGW
jgi:L-ascorbate metabolism protein UlaG (beta-lactamase superfamily)